MILFTNNDKFCLDKLHIFRNITSIKYLRGTIGWGICGIDNIHDLHIMPASCNIFHGNLWGNKIFLKISDINFFWVSWMVLFTNNHKFLFAVYHPHTNKPTLQSIPPSCFTWWWHPQQMVYKQMMPALSNWKWHDRMVASSDFLHFLFYEEHWNDRKIWHLTIKCSEG